MFKNFIKPILIGFLVFVPLLLGFIIVPELMMGAFVIILVTGLCWLAGSVILESFQ